MSWRIIISVDLNNIAILNINGPDYCCNINRISKDDALNLLKNTDLTEKREHYKDKKL